VLCTQSSAGMEEYIIYRRDDDERAAEIRTDIGAVMLA